jgi:hypothetical protein
MRVDSALHNALVRDFRRRKLLESKDLVTIEKIA